MAIGQPLIRNRTDTNTGINKWIACPKPNRQAKLRLYCFPYAGAGASVFYSWADLLPEKIEVCPIQLPGRETRIAELPFTRLEPLVKAAARDMFPHLDRPFAFFGHSMGALASFYLTRLLHAEHGIWPVHLFVSGHSAPQINDRRMPIHTLPEPDFIRDLRRLGGMPKEILAHSELMELLLPILRADFSVAETHIYHTSRPVECPISACGGLDDEWVSREDLAGWGEQTRSSFNMHMFPGDHFYLNTCRKPLLQVITRKLAEYICLRHC